MLDLSISLILNFLFIPNPTVVLSQIPNTSNLKYLLNFSSSSTSKKDSPTTSIIGVSFLYSLLLKLAIFGAF